MNSSKLKISPSTRQSVQTKNIDEAFRMRTEAITAEDNANIGRLKRVVLSLGLDQETPKGLSEPTYSRRWSTDPEIICFIEMLSSRFIVQW